MLVQRTSVVAVVVRRRWHQRLTMSEQRLRVVQIVATVGEVLRQAAHQTWHLLSLLTSVACRHSTNGHRLTSVLIGLRRWRIEGTLIRG